MFALGPAWASPAAGEIPEMHGASSESCSTSWAGRRLPWPVVAARPRSSKRAGPHLGGPARPLFESRESFLAEGPVRLHGKDGPVGLHEDALGVAAQDEFADL